MVTIFRFSPRDLQNDLPEPGSYGATVISARFRHSAQGNQMLQVTYKLLDLPEEHAQVIDYFVLDGVSSRGMATARRRLVQLCRACGIEPHSGDELPLKELKHAQLQLKVVHDQYQDERRLKVVAYRSLNPKEMNTSC